LLDESAKTARKLPERIARPLRIAVACGEMPAGTLDRALEPLRTVEGLDVRLVVVKNNTLGGNVGCSGLLFGKETAEALRSYVQGEDAVDLVFLPRRMFDFSGVRTLDEWRVETFQEELAKPVIVAEWTRDIWAGVQRVVRGEAVSSATPEVLRLTALG
jgi:NifB/MoaA-like Fe-S oxidoreductase